MKKKLFLLFLFILNNQAIANTQALTQNFNLDNYNNENTIDEVKLQQKELIEVFLPELKQRFPNEDWLKIETLNTDEQFEFLKMFVAEKAFLETCNKFISEIKEKSSTTNREYIQEDYEHESIFYAKENYTLNPEHCFYTCTNEQGIQELEQIGKECKNRYKFCIDETPIPENFEKYYMSTQPTFNEIQKGICQNNYNNGIASIHYTRDDYANNTRTEYYVSLSCGFNTENGLFNSSIFRITESTSDLNIVRQWENQQKIDIQNGIMEDIMSKDGVIDPKWKSSIMPETKAQGIIKNSDLSNK